MQYCTDCRSVEQGTITKTEERDCVCKGAREICCRCNATGIIEVEYEICAACESEDDTLRYFDEDAGQDR